MSNTYIKPIHSEIGEYKFSDRLFDDDELDTAISGINKTLDTHNSDIQYLSSILSGLNFNSLQHAIANVGILRPSDENELYLKIDVFQTSEMTDKIGDKIGTIDLSNTSDWKYFEALLINNGDSSDSVVDPLRSEYFPGTQWIKPAEIDAAIKQYSGESASFTGYGPAFSNSPVNVNFLKWLEYTIPEDVKKFNRDTKFYLRFVWYYVSENVSHTSDHFSMVVPSYAEVGAIAGNAASKSELADLKQALEIDITTAKYLTDDELDQIATSASKSSSLDYSVPGYYVQPYQCTVLESFGSNKKNIILQDYAEGKTYKLKFKTGSSAVTVGNAASMTQVSFNVNYGNGPEASDDLNDSALEFNANTTYLIAVNLGMIQVIAQN